MMEPSLLSLHTPWELARILAERARTLRLLKGWTRATLASRAGVTPASLKRFETTAAASFELVLRVAFALGHLEDFANALQPPKATSLAELKARAERPVPKRGRF